MTVNQTSIGARARTLRDVSTACGAQ